VRIWLVDDDDTFRTLLAQFAPFFSAKAVLHALQKQTPDAILLDVDMPGVNGVKAIQSIKKALSSTAVLMLATYFNHKAKKQSLAAGAVDFLLENKPSAAIVAPQRAANNSHVPKRSLHRNDGRGASFHN
jgi:DNA-binding NarL/FixJ family response regulator